MFAWISRTWEAYRTQSPLRFELTVLAVALVLGLLVLPLLIYLAGRLTLGSYANGRPLALLGDYLRGLANGHLSVWIAVLGPYGFILLGRLFAAIWRRSH